MFQRTLSCLRRASVTIPKLSPTHTRAKIIEWSVEVTPSTTIQMECYDPIFVLQCSPDLVTEGYREHLEHEPFMIVEAHDEGDLSIKEGIETDRWYEVGTEIGVIDDLDDDDEDNAEWLWQAYSHGTDDQKD